MSLICNTALPFTLAKLRKRLENYPNVVYWLCSLCVFILFVFGYIAITTKLTNLEQQQLKTNWRNLIRHLKDEKLCLLSNYKGTLPEIKTGTRNLVTVNHSALFVLDEPLITRTIVKGVIPIDDWIPGRKDKNINLLFEFALRPGLPQQRVCIKITGISYAVPLPVTEGCHVIEDSQVPKTRIIRHNFQKRGSCKGTTGTAELDLSIWINNANAWLNEERTAHVEAYWWLCFSGWFLVTLLVGIFTLYMHDYQCKSQEREAFKAS